jgi:MSHA biogenesis protein MshQ
MCANSSELRRHDAAGQHRVVRVLLAWLVWVLGVWAVPAQAATYTFRSDSFAWETAANPVTWTGGSCTQFPTDDDRATLTFTGGFTFTFAGTAYSSVRVLSNGMLQFGADTGFFRNYGNTNLPAGNASALTGCTASATTNVMLAYWTDLNPATSGTGSVTWEQKGTAPNRYVVVSWTNINQYGSSTTPYTFQVILYESGEFKYQYGNSNASGSAATIGVQVGSGDYTLYSYNSGYNANGSAIRWFIASGTPARVAEYRMDEFNWTGTVGEVADSSGNGHGGVRVGSASTMTPGQICRALNIPANTTTAISAVDTALDVDASIGSTGTLSFWVRSNVDWTSSTAAMLMSATTSATRPFYLQRNGGGALRFSLADSAGTVLTATTAAQIFGLGTWVHVAVTWRLATGSNQSTLRVYVNGALLTVLTGTTNGNLDPSLGSLFIGDNRSAATPSGATANSANGQIDEVRVYNFELSPAEIAGDLTQTHSCVPPLHHLDIRHTSGAGLTCTPSTLTLAACSDAACTALYTGGLTGSLTATGAGMTVNWPSGAAFSIPVGSSTVTQDMQLTTAGSVVMASSGLTPSASNATTCNFGSPSCTFTAADAGLLFDVPDHRAEVSNTVAITAVKKADNSAVCVPAFANVSKALNFKCAYVNPSTGTQAVRVGGAALNSGNNAAAACDGSGRTLSLAFDTTGKASTSVTYADAGRLALTATFTGSSGNETGLVMTGSDNFTAAPSSFVVDGISSGTLVAGTAFSASVTAKNSVGNTTPNFGLEAVPESATLAFVRTQPTGSGASNGSFSGSLGSFASGVASSSTLRWTEVGLGNLTATLTSGSYLASGMTATGTSSSTAGPFKPHHFDVVVAPACSSFSYAAQAFGVTVTARNAGNTTTLNYDGTAATTPNFAKATSLSDVPVLGLGSWAGNSLAATAFTAGVANVQPSYTFTTKTTAPQSLVLRATDANAVSSLGFAEGSTALRSGRLKLSNAFGSEKAALIVPVQAQYWSGNAWLQNSADSCTTLPAAAVVRAGYLDARGAATSAWSSSASAVSITSGAGSLSFSAPSPSTTGSLDFALNLGATTTDQSCLASHPASTGAALPWLRSQNGSTSGCAALWDRDPSARATFGIYAPETRKTVHVRELF